MSAVIHYFETGLHIPENFLKLGNQVVHQCLSKVFRDNNRYIDLSDGPLFGRPQWSFECISNWQGEELEFRRAQLSRPMRPSTHLKISFNLDSKSFERRQE